ncbi:hypothetical protein IFT48_25045 [Pseudomonas fluorescens]|uniref:hypothetical protein n=1 Tax=Pseudomonas fluorescens TaxID=294 RepID=UPI00190595F1|nr:hypothetical protein [Pseudomonas fluorescens]MBD8093266.1 hypothetical protein [Pseudomonas fluorescens]MBD8719219.1 hypothetical protein [Pseudomonas fluorescens]
MDSAQVEGLLTRNSDVVGYMQKPYDKCFDCAVKVANILRANNVRHRVVGMLIWSSFSRATETHFVVSVYDLDDSHKRVNRDEPFIVDPTSEQFLNCGPLFKYFHEWRCQLVDGTELGRKLVKLKEYENICHARRDLERFYGYPSEFDGGCLTTPSWYMKYRNDTALADAFENPSLPTQTLLGSPLVGSKGVIRDMLTRRRTLG